MELVHLPSVLGHTNQMELATKIAKSIATTSSCKNTILVTIVVFFIRICTKFLWPKNTRLRSFTFRRRNPGKKKKGDDDQAIPYCVVCLYEATGGERLRKLPKCNHCFHVVCIDQWFQAHSTCPLCRDQVFLLHQREAQQRGLAFYFLAFLQVVLSKLADSLNSVEISWPFDRSSRHVLHY
uniref:Uncharacterized protein MANES_01G275000 n=1 Tax=Rhizophora mucronata TaxID=61149 RepID=A0A2P2MIT7_RHIMU